MEQAVEWYVAITATAVGASHIWRPRDWAEAYGRLASWGALGAFLNGGVSLVTGAAIVAGHRTWAWPGAVITAFGWLCVAKGIACWLAPERALRSMSRGGESPREFVVAGVVALAIGGWACYCLWLRIQ